MAPRIRISKIQTQAVAPVVHTRDGASRSIGIQTDAVAPVPVVPRSSKRQKIMERIKKLANANSSQEPPSAAPSSSRQPADPYPNGFVPTAREKACQVDEKELCDGSGTEPQPPKSLFEQKMEDLKNMMERRRVESITWDRNRLEDLFKVINHNPPPRWELACDMWMEVDKLENRIEAFEIEEERMKKAAATQKKAA